MTMDNDLDIDPDDDSQPPTAPERAPVAPYFSMMSWPSPGATTGGAIDALRRLFLPPATPPASLDFADPGLFLRQGVRPPGTPPPTNSANPSGGVSQPSAWPDFNQCTVRARIDPSWEGEDVKLPNGQSIPDPSSPTKSLKSPLADLSPVAAAGRETGAIFRQMLADPYSAESAGGYLAGALFAHLGHGGTFDYQRGGKQLLGLLDSNAFTQLPNFRNVSNFNVGLLLQQAGIPLEQALAIAGTYARLRSSNYRPDQSYGLDLNTRRFTELGYRTGESGVFGKGSN